MTDQTTDYDGCNRRCRLAGAHTLAWGECEHAPQPEPTVSLSCVYTDTDGHPSIGFDTYTVPELARLIEPVLGNPLKATAAARRIVHRHDEQPAAVPVPPPADQTARRDRIAEALYERERPPRDPAWAEAFAMDREVFEAMAAVLSLTAVERQFLTFALDLAADEMASRGDEFGDEDEAALETLRRVAAEEQPAETQGTTTDKAAALGLTDTDYRARSHAAAVATIRAAIPGMYAHVGFRLEDVLNEADEVQPPETQAHEPTHTWTVESPRRDNWASWGTTYDDRDWALESYEHSTKNAPARPFRLVRATTTYTIEAEHTPPTARPAVGEQPETQEAPRPHTLDGAAETEEKLDLTPTREARPECAHCWREIENRGTPNMGGPTHDNWVHVPGGFTVCFPQRGGDSPRAEPRTPE